MNKGQGKQKNEFAVGLGRLGGLARARKLSKIQRIDIARKGGYARRQGKQNLPNFKLSD